MQVSLGRQPLPHRECVNVLSLVMCWQWHKKDDYGQIWTYAQVNHLISPRSSMPHFERRFEELEEMQDSYTYCYLIRNPLAKTRL